MVKKIKKNEKEIFICEICGLGYEDKKIAEACQNFCSTHHVCSLEITRKAIYFPEQDK